MENLSLTQEYLLSTLGEKGKYSSMQIEKGICLVAAGILELLMESLQKKGGTIRNHLNEQSFHRLFLPT